MKAIRSKCFVCGSDGEFRYPDTMTLLREANCSLCGASLRSSDVAHAIVRTFTGKADISLDESGAILKELRIFEADSTGRIHAVLKNLPHYVCAEYFDEVPAGQIKDGIRCEDLTRLTFADDSFDLVITQDVLEHVSDPKAAFREIRRVLKPEGYHIFTVPLHQGRPTVTRATRDGNAVRNALPPVHHGDPLRKEGALVYTDFGDDMVEQLDDMGMRTVNIPYEEWYRPEEITFVDDETYGQYLAARDRKELLSFFRYNSVVTVSMKKVMPFTGERYVPELGGDLAYEHLHRYAVARENASGKTVLDIASGEGYGSSLLAGVAEKVVGVDVSPECIAHAREKYGKRKNLEFMEGSCAAIPCPDAVFDLVVSFETIEHLSEHERMMAEVTRVLKKDGVLIISSPNKAIYKKDDEGGNEHHIRELTLQEFLSLLKSKFRHVGLMGQRLTFSSHIWHLESPPPDAGFIHYYGDAANVASSLAAPYEALYFIAFCTNAARPVETNKVSLFTERTDALYADYSSAIPSLLKEKDRYIQRLKGSFSWRITAPLRWIRRLF